MARIRSVKPEFNTSEAIAVLSIPAQLHFVKLWTYCDDEGRGVDNAKLIKGAIWPLEDTVTVGDVEGFQAELEARGRIVRYETDGKQVFEVANWSEHQKPQHPKPSTLSPAPEKPHEAYGSSHEAAPETAPVVVVGEVVGEGEVVVAPGEASPPARKRDELFEALVGACGIALDEIPESARGAYNRSLKSLRALGATPDDVYERAGHYRRAWPGASLTPTALERRWAECRPVAQAPSVSNGTSAIASWAER